MGTLLGSLGLSWRLLKAMLGHLGAMLGHLEAMLVCGGYVGPFGSYVRTMLGSLAGALLLVFGASVATFGSYVGPCGGHAKTMFGNLWLVWSFLEAMLCRYVGTLLGSFGLSW